MVPSPMATMMRPANDASPRTGMVSNGWRRIAHPIRTRTTAATNHLRSSWGRSFIPSVCVLCVLDEAISRRFEPDETSSEDPGEDDHGGIGHRAGDVTGVT